MGLVEKGKWLSHNVFVSILVLTNFVKMCHMLEFEVVNLLEIDQDAYRSLPELITSKGYLGEEHDVITVDGYILGVYRIPYGIKHQDGVEVRQPILLHHGLMSSGSDWVINGPEPNKSLAFLLADAGYDVWIANSRGNTYSKRHIKYSSNNPRFWKFSLDEIALFDLPAVIDYILETTNQEQLVYVGHSMGTTVAFMLLSEFPEYNKKVKAVMALAPVAYVGHYASPMKILVPFRNQIAFIWKLFGQTEILKTSSFRNFLIDVAFNDQQFREIFSYVWFFILGGSSAQISENRLSVIFHHYPAGGSVNSLLHYGQMVASKEFTKFDYGKKTNMKFYGQDTPPKYNVEAITAPIGLFWSQGDLFADPTDVTLLVPRIKNLVENYRVPLPEFGHADFVFAVDADKLVYQRLMAVLEDYRN